MYFCYPKLSNKIVACVIARFACRQLFPLTAQQLSCLVHAIADSKNQSRLNCSGYIRPGSTVELQNLDTGERGWLQLVNPAQADYGQGRISLLSPLGCVLPGKTADMVISLQLLGCVLRFRILTVLYVQHSVKHDTLNMSKMKELKMKTPDIVLSTTDYDRLDALLANLSADSMGYDTLSQELERASVVAPEQLPANVISMNSSVRFRLGNGKTSILTLVYPKDVSQNGNTISVLAPVGCALLGLKTGDTINWPLPGGDMSTITVEELLYQPERAGAYYR